MPSVLSPVPLPAVRGCFDQVLSDAFFDQLQQALGLPAEQGVYTRRLVCWLLLYQRLHGNATLADAVAGGLADGGRALLPQGRKRVREGSLSAATGAYSQGRQRLPVGVAHALFAQAHEQAAVAGGPAGTRRRLVLDGASLALAHTPELVRAYPPAVNQHGVMHWPQLQLVVAQDLDTGVAERPAWGPMYGPAATSEQALTRALLPRLPAGSLLLGDINFGVFQVVWPAHAQHGHDVLVRLQPSRARRLAGGTLPAPGTDTEVAWRPRAADRQALPEAPPEACVRGRLVVATKELGGTQEPLYLFTTLSLPASAADAVAALYGRRWATVELDLRALKHTVHLEGLRGKSVAMVDKELLLGLTAWNLVRLAMLLAAQAHGRDARRLSFARAQSLVLAFLPGLLAAQTPERAGQELRRLLRAVAQCTLPKRKGKPRRYPRALWLKARVYPKRPLAPRPDTPPLPPASALPERKSK